MDTPTTKKWFVILQQEEVDKIQTPIQIAVFSAIKSFASNGKKDASISYRNIYSRSKVSLGHIKTVIDDLIKIGLIKVVGEQEKRGGKVFTYRTLTKNKCSPTERLNTESVHPVNESVQSPCLKNIQSNKVINKSKGKKSPTTEIETIFSTYKEKINTNSRLLEKARDKITTRLKVWSPADLLKAIDNFSKDTWWMDNNAHRGIAWFFNTDDRVEQFINLKPRQKQEETYRPVEEVL